MDNNVFSVNNEPLFNSIAHTQGGSPHLLQYLLDEYVKHLNGRIEERTKRKEKSVDLSTAVKNTSMMAFLKWAKEYLTKVRPVTNFFVDENLGIRLNNNANVVLCPGINIQGTMQDAGAVNVTHGVSQSGQEGVIQTSDFKI